MPRKVDAHAPTVLDVFSGCGGISLGFRRAGFRIVAGIELDETAAATHGANFFPGQPGHAKARDVRSVTRADILDLAGRPQRSRHAVDVIVAGPPCQAFSRIGRAKLREVQRHPRAFLLDERAQLWRDLLELVEALRPRAVVIENVPDILNHGGFNVAAAISACLEAAGYVVGYSIFNAAQHGVPQLRDRAFIIGVDRSLQVDPSDCFPAPTRHVALPFGYRNVRLAVTGPAREDDCRHFHEPELSDQELPLAWGVGSAIWDLPELREHLDGVKAPRRRRLADGPELPYRRAPGPGTYAHLMRTWPGFEGGEGVCDHVTRFLPRDFRIFKKMKPGDQYPRAYGIAGELARAEKRRRERAAGGRPLSARAWAALQREYVPPYDPDKFPNKWQKLDRRRPSHTITAHLGKDTYSHIHPEDRQARVITPREAARLQSFPDGFVFEGAMNAIFRQVGNAVPPLLAAAVAGAMREALEGAVDVEARPRRRRGLRRAG